MKGRIWCIFVMATASLWAQTITTGEVTGLVLDPTGAVVTTATVLLKSLDTGETRVTRSNAVGLYRFTFARPGKYELSSSSAGLKSDVGRLIAAVGQVQVLDLHLKLTGIREVELVTDAAPMLDKDNANATYAVSTRQLELLPLPGGDLAAVAYSAPGVVINTNMTDGSFALQGVGSTSNLFTFNGAESMEPYYNVNNSGVSGLLLGANEIQEAAIVQNAYDGQYGRQAGAQVNYVTKSGGNGYHGNAAYSYNGDWMNANDFFGNSTGTPRPHGVSNQYAAAMGGRVIRDRLFFFADTEGLRFAQPGYTSVVTIPSPAFESYSLRTIQLAQTALYQEMFDLYNAAPGHERAVAVTNGNGPLQDSRLGCGKLAGTATGGGGVFGSDVSCAQTWGTNIPTQTSEWLLSARADYNVNPRQRVFFRFRTDHGLMPTSSAINPAFGPSISFPDYEGQVNHTYVITPHMVNNFIGSGTYNDYVYSVADLSAALKLFPFRFNILDGRGFTALGASSSYPSGRRAGQPQIVDDVSYNFGRHSLKAGVNYRGNRESDLQYSPTAYIPRVTFRSLKDLAAGVLNPSGSGADLYTQAFAKTPTMHLRLYTLGLYLEDHWAVTQDLKLTIVLRFDRTGNPYCADYCFSRLVEPFPVLSKGLSIPYDQSIQAGLAHAYYHVEPIVPQPRLGLAYSPAWSTGMVFRGGIGVFMDLYPAYFAGKMGGNPPNVFTSFIYSGTVNNGGDGSAWALALASGNAFQN